MLERKAFWARRIVALDSSGLSRAEFCRRRGINYQTMSWWVRRLSSEGNDGRGQDGRDQGVRDQDVRGQGRSSTEDGVLSFVEVPVRVGATAMPYEVVLGGRSIRIGSGFEDDTLARLIQVVEAC